MDSSNNKPFSLQNMIRLIIDNFGLIFLFALFFIAGFFAGSLYTENQKLRAGGTGTGTVATAPTAGAPAAPTEEQLKSIPAPSEDDHYRGNIDADVVLVEYSDFECPFCAQFYPAMQQLMSEYGDRIAWVHRQYPLPFHPQAEPSARASECVAELGGNDAFWAFSDKIFEINSANSAVTAADITTAAQASGVNMNAFNDCFSSGKYAEEIQAQMTAGSAAGVTGTPGTIILTRDGRAELLPGAVDFATLKAAVDKYL